MPAHLITSDQVDAWLADSVNRQLTYHRTSAEAAGNILRQRVDVSRGVIGAYGQGFYTATRADSVHGAVELALAVRLRRPLQGPVDEVAGVVDALARLVTGSPTPRITPEVTAGVRRELLDLGYDGLIVWDAGGDGIDYVIALQAETVKVVQR